MRTYIILLLVLVTSCKSQEMPVQELKPTPVHADKPVTSNVPVYIETLGTLYPAVSVDVRPRLNGIISHVHVKEGEWVEEGKALFQLDSKPYLVKVQQAKAQVASSKVQETAASKKMARFKTLADKNLISQNEWEQIETALLQAQAQVELDLARLKEASLDLEYCTVLAQKSGRLGRIDIHPGHLVSHEAPLAQIVSIDPIMVEFYVTEKEFSRFSHETNVVHIHRLSDAQKQYAGSLCFTDNTFDVSTGQILLRAKVENKNLEIRPGMGVKVKIPVATVTDAILVPQKAVKHNQFGAFLYVVQPDNTVLMRQVQLGGEHEHMFIIQSGLDKEELIITEGHQKVNVGSKVEIVT